MQKKKIIFFFFKIFFLKKKFFFFFFFFEKKILQNYFIFAESLKKSNINLITVECAFNDGPFYIPEEENVYRLRSNSIMWQKERLINYGVSKLPESCKYFAWIDCDVLFLQDNWLIKNDRNRWQIGPRSFLELSTYLKVG